MGRIGGIVSLILLLALVAGGLYLAYGHFPAPATHVERVLPDARFAR